MWVKIRPDMSLTMDIELTGVDAKTRDADLQLYEDAVREALRERLKKVFDESEVAIYDIKVGVAREKYITGKAA